MNVTITKWTLRASVQTDESTPWYSTRIGESFEVKDYSDEYYQVITGKDKGGWIYRKDCKTMKDLEFTTKN